MPNQERLNSITGLKVLATVLIFIWHTGYFEAPDLGARCVEIFFVTSGLLMAWNHEGSYKGTVGECLGIFRQKFLKIYPIYIFGILIAVLNMAVAHNAQGMGMRELLPTTIAHLTMTQAWFKGIAFKFDGAAWYLSAILFCYAATPVLSFLVSADKTAIRKKRLFTLGLGCLALAFFVELGETWYPDGFPVSVHSWPPACLARYGIGYVAGCWLLSLDSMVIADRKTSLAISEIVVTAMVLLTVILLNGRLPRAGFTFLFAAWVSLRAIGVGPVSKLLSIGALQLPARWELEFYVLHQPVMQLVISLLSSVCARKVYVLLAFVATAALAVAFKFIQGRIHKMGRAGSISVHER